MGRSQISQNLVSILRAELGAFAEYVAVMSAGKDREGFIRGCSSDGVVGGAD